MIRAALALAVLATVATGCGARSLDTSKAVATTHVLLPKSYRFDPAVIEVKAGSRVTWTNADSFTHTVELDDGSDRSDHRLDRGHSVTLTFRKPGVYPYHCTLHPTTCAAK